MALRHGNVAGLQLGSSSASQLSRHGGFWRCAQLSASAAFRQIFGFVSLVLFFWVRVSLAGNKVRGERVLASQWFRFALFRSVPLLAHAPRAIARWFAIRVLLRLSRRV